MSKKETSKQSQEYKSKSFARWSVFRSSMRTSSSSSSHSFYERTERLGHIDDASRRPSEPVFSTDAVPFQMPGYQSSFPSRQGPFASLREGNRSRAICPAFTQPLPEPRGLSTTSSYSGFHNWPRPAASDPALTSSSQKSPVPTYPIKKRPKAKVLLINIKKFLDGNEERLGSDNDLKELKKLFKGFEYDVVAHTDLKASMINKKIDEFSGSLAKYDISVVVVMSHGNNIVAEKEIPGGFTQIFGADGKPVVIEDILLKFTATKCPGMLGKPKIFIFQCCRGAKSEFLASDHRKSEANQHGDMLIAYSTLPGFYSVRNEEKGSWYIQSICKVFQQHASDYDVENLLKIVHEQLNMKHPQYKQTSTYENRGFKVCYLQSRT